MMMMMMMSSRSMVMLMNKWENPFLSYSVLCWASNDSCYATRTDDTDGMRTGIVRTIIVIWTYSSTIPNYSFDFIKQAIFIIIRNQTTTSCTPETSDRPCMAPFWGVLLIGQLKFILSSHINNIYSDSYRLTYPVEIWQVCLLCQ
jgi:hypothetical protein